VQICWLCLLFYFIPKKYAALGIDKNRKSDENTGTPKSRRDIKEEDTSVDDSNNEGAEHDMEEMNVTNK
jgi:hypothetical protein